MNTPRMPIEEARRLWRQQTLPVDVTTTHTVADPGTGEPIELDVTRPEPFQITPEFLGYTLDELDPDDED